MIPVRAVLVLLHICAIALAGKTWAADAQCSTQFRLPILLRLPGSAATSTLTTALLIGDLTPGLRIVDATNGRLLWTASASGTPTQRFADMQAGFSTSLAALDTDGDGAHDRIYAGDLLGRLWRFDMDNHGAPSSWLAGAIFADLSQATPGRGFIAAPDLTLIAPAGTKPWLSIALGTANTSTAMAAQPIHVLNRFYVLKDRAPLERWTQRQYDSWRPLVESDLMLAEGTRPATVQDNAGFYINLGAQQVAAASLTVDGNTYYTTVATNASLLHSCVGPPTPILLAPVNVGSVSADGALNAVTLDTSAPYIAPADSAVTLVRDESDPSGTFVCQVAGHTLPGCSVESTLHRSFWRREDAD
ncbi:MAG: hypothetical protein ABI616_07250 [Pseudomonadota bacterium]